MLLIFPTNIKIRITWNHCYNEQEQIRLYDEVVNGRTNFFNVYSVNKNIHIQVENMLIFDMHGPCLQCMHATLSQIFNAPFHKVTGRPQQHMSPNLVNYSDFEPNYICVYQITFSSLWCNLATTIEPDIGIRYHMSTEELGSSNGGKTYL